MSLYRCTICLDGQPGVWEDRQIVVHWDDLDANTFVVAPFTVAAADLDEERLVHELGRMGFRLVSTNSDNIGRGWAIVSRSRTDRPFYNPLDRSWCAYLTDEDKRAIRNKWPDAAVPGVHNT